MIRLITDTQELDTNGIDEATFTYQMEDIVDVSKRKSSFSKTIVLPGTKKNNKYFKHIFEVRLDNEYDVRKRVPITVRTGINNVIKGYMQLLNIIDLDGYIEYEISVTQSNANIWNDMKGRSLSELDFSRFNHIRNKQNIVDTWDTKIQYDGNDRVFEIGNGYVYPTINVGNHLNEISKYQYVEDTFPAFYIKQIWDTMFEDLGFGYESNFLNSEYFKRLIMPFSKPKLELSDEQMNKREVVAGVSKDSPSFGWGAQNLTYRANSVWKYSDDQWTRLKTRLFDDTTPYGNDKNFRDDGDQWSNQAYQSFKASKAGRYNIDFNLKINMQGKAQNGEDIRWAGNDGVVKYTYGIYVYDANGNFKYRKVPRDSNGNTTSYDWSPVDDNWRSSISGVDPIFDKDGETKTIATSLIDDYLNEGDEVYLIIGLYTGDDKLFNTKGAAQGSNTRIRLLLARSSGGVYSTVKVKLSDSTTPPNEMVDMNQIIDEKMGMQDFFKSMVDMFNLLIIQDPADENKLKIEPRTDFFNSRKRLKNWDKEKKLDYQTEIKYTPLSDLDISDFKFSHKEDDDYLNKKYTDEYNEVYGSKVVETGYDFSNKDIDIETSFSPTIVSSFLYQSKVQPYFLAGEDISDLKPKKVNPRILFYGGVKNCIHYKIVDDADDDNKLYKTNYAYCGMTDDIDDARWDLDFGLPKDVYYDAENYTTNTLYNMFYKNYIESIIDKNSMIMEAKFHLTPKDIDDFDFRDIIYLKGQHWRIVKIKNYMPLVKNKTTKVKLLKVINYSGEEERNVTVLNSNGNCPTDVKIIKTRYSTVGFETNGNISHKQGSDTKTKYIYKSETGTVTEDCCQQLNGVWINGQCESKNGYNNVFGTVNKKSRVIAPHPPIGNPNNPGMDVNNNTVRSANILIRGTDNYVQSGVKNSIVIGDNSSISQSNTLGIEGTGFDKKGMNRGDTSIGINEEGTSMDINTPKLDLTDADEIKIGETNLTNNGNVFSSDYFRSGYIDDGYTESKTGGTTFDYDESLDELTNNIEADNVNIIGELFTTIERWTIDLINKLTYTLYATDPLAITSVEDIVGTPSTTFEVNDIAYTLGDPIASGDKIDISVDIPSVIKLKIEK